VQDVPVYARGSAAEARRRRKRLERASKFEKTGGACSDGQAARGAGNRGLTHPQFAEGIPARPG